MNQIQYKMESEAGSLYLVASEQGLQGIFWHKQPVQLVKSLNPLHEQEKIILNVIKQIEEYFKGQRKTFNIVLSFSGTSFQKQVWRELSKIPFGKTVSYKDIAKRIKNSKAVRAVGSANGKNPFSIIIPCHRVIAADGSIGGYGGGVPVKRRLLELEQRIRKAQPLKVA